MPLSHIHSCASLFSRSLKPLAIVAGLLLPSASFAQWELVGEDSTINYLSTKVFPGASGSATENNSISQLSGSIDDKGQVALSIDLTSVSTNIDIRNQRLLEHVFNVKTHGNTALLTTEVPAKSLTKGQHALELPAKLKLAGVEKPVTLSLSVNVTDTHIHVASSQPTLLNTSDYDLGTGVAKLVELAGLGHIVPTIPVSFVAAFAKK